MTEQVKLGVTIDELMQIEEDRWIEVINGEIREIEMSAASFLHGYIGANILELVRPFVRQNKLGAVLPDGVTYVLSMVAQTIKASRLPDVSFVRRGRIPPNFNLDRPFPGAPDLAVEVISTSEDEAILDEKVSDYFAAGTEQVWAVFPRPQQVHVFLRDENPSPSERRYHIYKMGDILEAPTLFPGLKIAIGDIFHIDALE